jgi:hypothetical protein
MGDALLQHYREITTLIAEADRQDVRVRYRIAVHCQDVRNGDGNGGRYGAKAVRNLTLALKWSKSLVYAFADVAVTWPDADKFDELVARSNKFDKPLSWSHFVLLATVTDDDRREKLIEGSLHNGWTVRELQMKMRTGPTEQHEEADAAEPKPKLPPDLAAAVQNYGSQVATFKRTADTFGQHVRRKMEEVDPTDLGDSLLEQMRQARHDLYELLSELDETIWQFEDRRRSQSLVPSDDEAPATGDSDEPTCDESNEEQVTKVESAIPVLT